MKSHVHPLVFPFNANFRKVFKEKEKSTIFRIVVPMSENHETPSPRSSHSKSKGRFMARSSLLHSIRENEKGER